MRVLKYLAVFSLLSLTACSNLILKPADFSWPVENVLNVDNSGKVEIQRYSMSFNTKELFLKETGDSTAFQNKQLRIIRNNKGYYFMTANNFKNVYVFSVKNGEFALNNKIEISDSSGISNPVFNQRPPYIELIYGKNKTLNLTEEGIAKKEDQK